MGEKSSEKGDNLSLGDPRRFSVKSSKSSKGDAESLQEEKIPYPTHVFFIFGNEFCERFAYYGMKTVLAMYLTNKLGFSEDTATPIYTAFSSLCYFMSIPGAIISDSYLGKFRTILYVSIVYACGSVLLAIGSLNIGGDVPISLIALLIIAFGTGGIKPCVSAFGGDQFKLPQQAPQMVQYFAIFYFSINLGSFISTIITPIVRSDISCFGQETCFFASFIIPAGLFIIAIIVFVIGKPKYTDYPPTGENLLVKTCRCIGNAIVQKRKMVKVGDKREHWLDYAQEKYGEVFVDDVKAVMNVCVVFLPICIYFTLYDQTGTIWVFQARRMDGKLGGITLKADQMQAVNSILVLSFIPIFDRVVYPIAAKMNCLTKPLNRIAWGGVLLAVAFVVAGVVELFVEDTYPKLPKEDEAHVSFVNGVGCDVDIQHNLPHQSEFSMNPFEEKTFENVQVNSMKFTVAVNMATCKGDIVPTTKDVTGDVSIDKEDSVSIFIYVDPDSKELKTKEMENDDKEKDGDGNPKIRLFYNLPQAVIDDYDEVFFECHSKRGDKTFDLGSGTTGDTDYSAVEPFGYTISLQDGSKHIESKDELSFEMGGVYNVMVQQMDDKDGRLTVNMVTMTSPNSYHMFLQIPQYSVLTAGEILFSITGNEFSYKEAPKSMKCVVQSVWLLTTAFGDIIFIFLSMIDLGSNAYESFLFSGIQICPVLVFVFLAWRYKPYVSKVEKGDGDNKSISDTSSKSKDEGFAE